MSLPPLRRSAAFSYLGFLIVLLLAGWMHLATLLVTILFSFFALQKLAFHRSKWLSIALFLVVVAAIFCAFIFFLRLAYVALPEIVATTIPVIVQFANRHGFELPFNDVASLKDVAVESVHGALVYLGNFARIATKDSVFLIVGVVIAIGIFLNAPPGEAPRRTSVPRDLYSYWTSLLAARFRAFYESFVTVMSAQLLISAINTAMSAVFVFGCGLHYAGLLVALTFTCGLLPIVGNLISNALIVGIAFTKSPGMAAWALGFLICVHKLEYFLNSRIVGARIRQPMWLTLVALILGERLMGIPGIILAPVVMNFIRVEGSRYSALEAAGGALPTLTAASLRAEENRPVATLGPGA